MSIRELLLFYKSKLYHSPVASFTYWLTLKQHGAIQVTDSR